MVKEGILFDFGGGEKEWKGNINILYVTALLWQCSIINCILREFLIQLKGQEGK